MTDIKYVCLSDTHFGSSGSLLTNLKEGSLEVDCATAPPVLINLISCLKKLIGKNEGGAKPYLVLNGDILELATVVAHESAMAFLRFMELAFPENGDSLFNDEVIYYVPGNHDHHLWETARETQYANYLADKDPKGMLEPAWHTTEMFVEEGNYANKKTKPVPAFFLNRLIQRFKHLKAKGTRINAVYPNFGLLSPDRQKCVVFHHGHFTESIYSAMSKLKVAIFPDQKVLTDVYQLEAENFAWIDFIWSTVGRSGEVGANIKSIYDIAADPEAMEGFMERLPAEIAARINIPLVPERFEPWTVRQLIKAMTALVPELERNTEHDPSGYLSNECFKEYVCRLLQGQLKRELKEIPADITFVFGHSHKPLEQIMDDNEFSQMKRIYNTGGWIYESAVPRAHIGGAVVLIDEHLNTVSLNIYREVGRDEQKTVGGEAKVFEALAHDDAPHSVFYREIEKRVEEETEVLSAFTSVVRKEIDERGRRMSDRRAPGDAKTLAKSTSIKGGR